MTATPQTASPTATELDDIQGNIIGFKNDHQRLLFVTMADSAGGKAFITGMLAEINTGQEVLKANKRYSDRDKLREDQLVEQDSWVNLAFTGAGLQLVGVPGLETMPPDFIQGMAARAQQLGDVGASAPETWTGAFTPGLSPLHALVIIAADSADLLDARTAAVRSIMTTAPGVAEVGPAQEGKTRPEPNRGHEHFGFKDGISQPGIAGLTKSSKGGDEIAAGEFLIGYPDQDGQVSGTAIPQPVPQPGDPNYLGNAPAPGPPLPPWTRNGSFLVYRKLRQNVAGFQQFIASQAATQSLPEDTLGAKLVGRWKSGAPLEHVPGTPAGVDPAASDPSGSFPDVLKNERINNFGYQSQDSDGHATPLAAHIRKVYPRDGTPGEAQSNRHRLLRRGIPYGPDFIAGEPAYGTVVPDEQDRGLLFLCYQSSITRGFEFVQQSWVNKADFPTADSGQDPIISQDASEGPFTIPPVPLHLTIPRWVNTTGGAYLFSPGIEGLRTLAQQSVQQPTMG